MENNMIPQLRFSEFEGLWDIKTLDNITTRIGDGLHGTPKYNVNGKYYFINGNNLVDGKISISESTKKVDENEAKKHNKELNSRTILLSINGTIGNLALYNNEKVMLGKSAAYINLRDNVDIAFIYNTLKGLKTRNFFFSELTGSTIKNLSLKTIRETKISIPDPAEQTKISTFLTAVDKRIILLQKKKIEMEQYKKSVMQKLFTQAIRFKRDDGCNFPDWEEKQLGEIGDTFNGLTGKTKVDFGSGKPYIQYMQIFSSSRINTTNFGLVKIEEGENQSRVQYGDVFFTTSSETPNEIGTSSVLRDQVKEVYLNSFCFGYRPNSLDELVPEFSQFFFRSEKVRREIVKLAQGSTRFNMSKVEFMKLKFNLPKTEEQLKIAKFLSSIDKYIENINNQINETVVFKQGLLQKMFV